MCSLLIYLGLQHIRILFVHVTLRKHIHCVSVSWLFTNSSSWCRLSRHNFILYSAHGKMLLSERFDRTWIQARYILCNHDSNHLVRWIFKNGTIHSLHHTLDFQCTNKLRLCMVSYIAHSWLVTKLSIFDIFFSSIILIMAICVHVVPCSAHIYIRWAQEVWNAQSVF